MSYKVEKIVNFNDGIGFVLDKPIEFKYRKEGNLIIGIDDTNTFVKTYIYERPSPGFHAFGGHKFDIELENGEVIHCDGQWWDGGYQRAERLLGEKLVSATYNDVESLKNCYVFTGCTAIETNLAKLRDTYKDEIQGYWKYEALLKGRDRPIREDRKMN